MNRPHIAVIGLMGVGKSTTADMLASRLGLPHRDCDRDIEALSGRSGREIAAHDGVDVLHELEEAVALAALADVQPSVISVAGSVIESPGCRVVLQERSFVVWLDLAVDHLVDRIASGSHRRPMSIDDLRMAAARRRPLMRELADLVIDARQSPEAIVQSVALAIAGAEKPDSAF